MKKLFQLVIMCFTALMLSACGTGGGESDEGIQIVESEPLDMAVSAEGEKAEDAENRAPGDNAAEPETDAETADLWTGEYNDRDVNEPNLAIRKNADGSYRIFIGIYRLAVFDDGHVVEYGTHRELYDRKGIYTEMFDKQAKFYRDGEGKGKIISG